MTIEIIHVPDLGGAESVEVIELCVAPGDSVEPEQSLLVLESDKATMDVPCPMAGAVKSLLVSEGDTVSEGTAIVELEIAELEIAELEIAEQEVADAETAVEPIAEAATPESAVESASEPAPAHQAAPAASEEQTVQLPDVGSEEAVEVIEISVTAGDVVSEGDTLLILETDKATMEIPSPASGEVVKMLVAEGDKIKQGDDIATLMAEGAAASAPVPAEQPASEQSAPAPAAPPVASAPQPAPASQQPVETGDGMLAGSDVYAGPAARQLARELGVDLRKVKATGPRGRILKEDLDAYLRDAVKQAQTGDVRGGADGSAIPVVPDIDFSQFGDTEIIPLNKIQKLTAANMQRSWLNVPHVTQFDEADITELEAFRKSLKPEAERRGTKVTPLPFLIKACAHALQANPEFNRSISSNGESFIQKDYINIGMAVDTPRGLVVPVVRNVNNKGIWQIADEVNELAAKARDGKLTTADMQGGCFTISSLGAIGGNGFTPIVNTPEVGILGVSKSQMKPVWDGSEFVPRLMLPLALSYDHRVINGADCGRFFTFLVDQLGDIRRLAL